jgi:glycosyltransferase involved in cell wall biosynthesis
VGFPLKQNHFSRARFAAATRIIASSDWVAEQLAASGVPRDRVTVIYEGVEIPTPVTAEMRREARARWKVRENEKLLGCVGVLLQDKGQEWAIQALAQLRREFPQCKLLLAGDGVCREALRRLATEQNLQDAVIFAGFVRDVENVYRALDVFVFPALFEGLGTSLLAAMAHGIPSITYFGCALGEIVENGKSGLQIEPKNPDALAEAIRSMVTDSDFAAKMGAEGRLRIEKVFSAERMVDETLKLYREISS